MVSHSAGVYWFHSPLPPSHWVINNSTVLGTQMLEIVCKTEKGMRHRDLILEMGIDLLKNCFNLIFKWEKLIKVVGGWHRNGAVMVKAPSPRCGARSWQKNWASDDLRWQNGDWPLRRLDVMWALEEELERNWVAECNWCCYMELKLATYKLWLLVTKEVPFDFFRFRNMLQKV